MDTVTGLFRRHLTAMRVYALELENVLGAESPIVKRIRSCAGSNELALENVLLRQTNEKPAQPFCSCCGSKRDE